MMDISVFPTSMKPFSVSSTVPRNPSVSVLQTASWCLCLKHCVLVSLSNRLCPAVSVYLTVFWSVCTAGFPPAGVADSSWTSQVCTWAALEALEEGTNQNKPLSHSNNALAFKWKSVVCVCELSPGYCMDLQRLHFVSDTTSFCCKLQHREKEPLTLTWLAPAPVVAVDVIQSWWGRGLLQVVLVKLRRCNTGSEAMPSVHDKISHCQLFYLLMRRLGGP